MLQPSATHRARSLRLHQERVGFGLFSSMKVLHFRRLKYESTNRSNIRKGRFKHLTTNNEIVVYNCDIEGSARAHRSVGCGGNGDRKIQGERFLDGKIQLSLLGQGRNQPTRSARMAKQAAPSNDGTNSSSKLFMFIWNICKSGRCKTGFILVLWLGESRFGTTQKR